MSDPVREAREQLIRVGLTGSYGANDAVPDLIVRSWRRSISSAVESSVPSQRYQDVDTDSLLCRAAVPVLDRWQHQLADTGTTLFLSDRGGSIVARRTSDISERRRLDSMHAAEGFDYSEESIGTNGLGTSMVEKRPVFVKGSQHYNDALTALACAAAPVYTPAGLVVGSVSLGGPLEAASPIMLSLTREISQQIEERLRASSRPQDLALAMSFMRFSSSQRPTVVMDQESILANTPGLPYVSVASHVMLWELLNSHNWSSSSTLRRELEATSIEVTARRVTDGPREHYVVHFSNLSEASDISSGLTLPSGAQVVGTALAPRKTAPAVVLVDGPRGSGRATVARRLHTERGSTERLEVFVLSAEAAPPWRTFEDLLTGGTDVLIRRVEEIDESEAANLAGVVERHRTARAAGKRASSLLLTSSRDQAAPAVQAFIDATDPVERTDALTRTPERIPGLVKAILNVVDPESRHTISPAALQSMVQWNWPGNIAELADTVAGLIGDAKGSVIERRICRNIYSRRPHDVT
ncbi:acetoin dehydrogenase operon transcriptional activator AcoR [Arthrobacter sp. Hiyo6]|nr:acetoin dehydrogenase operon transcriptional activator AcoR [Arthrobacter sp. Hiyo6]